MKDVARRSGVSVSTVSRVVNASGYVKARTRLLVEKAVAELGFVPSGAARGLVARRTGLLGLCLPDTGPADPPRKPVPRRSHVELVADFGPSPGGTARGSQYFGEILRGAEYAAWEAEYALAVTVARPPQAEARIRDLAGKVDGLVVVAGTLPDALLEHVAHRVPVVLVAGRRASGGYDHVGVDNGEGIRALVEHLVGAHHLRNLQFVAGPPGTPDDIDRFRGFHAAAHRLGLSVPAEPVLRGDFTREGARRLAEEVVAGHRNGRRRLPDALVCTNDATALGFLDVLSAEGVSVPGEVAVTGFDGIDGARTCSPRLTTVEQPVADLGRLAVGVLQACLANPRLPRQDLVVPSRALLRESCGTH
ncbi:MULTISPECIES: LacI family DNA-binding transcriptional regulator [unclassified Streptomyces]|uniref:LacI family DNA-binding transcriptional regulator n=1 Tax=unclassified Streptomyces TaxID=2593676 RepID=UPI0035DBD4A5